MSPRRNRNKGPNEKLGISKYGIFAYTVPVDAEGNANRTDNKDAERSNHSPWGFPISLLQDLQSGVHIVINLRLLNKRTV